ncbi:MAG: hypothetical protein AAB544_05125 [Patescibacteria group bacterium]
MLSLLRTTHKIRRTTQRINTVATMCAILLGLSVLTLANASVFCPGGSCGGIDTGAGVAATNIPGISTALPDVIINNIINTARNYVNIVALAVIIIAGFYLILGLGSDSSKETAKKIILYTAVGIAIINLAVTIVNFFNDLTTGTSTSAFIRIIQDVLDIATSYVGILAVAVIIIAGFYLILGLGSETSKETARKIILYTAVGIIIITLANVIVEFFQSINGPSLPGDLRDSILKILLFFINFAGLLAVAAIVIAGIMLILSMGDEGRKDTAKKTIIYAIVGLVVIILASAIVRFVAAIF